MMIETKKYTYNEFLKSPTKDQWHKIGIQRRAGVCTPLFSIYSQNSLGIGEIPDLELLIDWCEQTGLSIIQLLPLNDTGFNFTPYDSQSSFALDPMYLSLDKLTEVHITNEIKNQIQQTNEDPKFKEQNVNYEIKKIKLDLLWKIFLKSDRANPRFDAFIEKNKFWIHDYSLFKALKDNQGQRSWIEWGKDLKEGDPEKITFYSWLQWQLFEQFTVVKAYAKTKNILILGDLPLFVSFDSADVWANQAYFKLDYMSGAPPDAYCKKGQRWGMPTYNWEAMAEHNYDYYINKLKYAENFYDMFRIDHAIGLFRVWSIPSSEPIENGSENGAFDPADESIWEEHGKIIYKVIIENTSMLPCAEDLGAVPDCSPIVLKELSIPGLEVQRWLKNKANDSLRPVEEYRKNSIAVISTHDMAHFAVWWNSEATEEEKKLFLAYCQNESSIENQAEKSLTEIMKLAIEKISKSASIFSIQIIHDWLTLKGFDSLEAKSSRVNLPGIVSKDNWSIRMPISLEEMKQLEINKLIKEINIDSQRI